MGMSGNPAKAARIKRTNVGEAAVREAVRQGKQFILKPWHDTEVTVTTANEDAAVELVKLLQPVDTSTRLDMSGWIHTFHMLSVACVHQPEYRRELDAALREVQEAWESDKIAADSWS